MATIDIGKLAFTHKGDYNGSTAYVARDVVYYSGSAYIAKTSTTGNLPTSTAHWSTFASGSGGIWDSGLSLGSAGQAVKVNSGGTALEFGAVAGGKVLQAVSNSTTSNFNVTTGTPTYVSGMPSVDITPSATSSKILVMFNGGAHECNGGNGVVSIYRDSTNLGDGSNGFFKFQHHANYREPGSAGAFLDSPNTTSQITYQLRIWNQSGGNSMTFGESCRTSIICIEIGA